MSTIIPFPVENPRIKKPSGKRYTAHELMEETRHRYCNVKFEHTFAEAIRTFPKHLELALYWAMQDYPYHAGDRSHMGSALSYIAVLAVELEMRQRLQVENRQQNGR